MTIWKNVNSGKRFCDGRKIQQVCKNGKLFADNLTLSQAETLIKSHIKTGDRYQEEENSEIYCDLSYDEIMKSWKETDDWVKQ